MTRAAEGGALPEGVERALMGFARTTTLTPESVEASAALRAAILAAIAPPVAEPVAWGVADRTGRVVITGERRSYCEAVKATYDDEMPSGRPFAIVPLYTHPTAPVAPSFDAALAALDYQPVDVRDNGTHVYELLGLDDVRAAHAAIVATRDARIATLEAALRGLMEASGALRGSPTTDNPAEAAARAALEAKS